ncbi:MAG: TIR domain-containing protein [Erysipelotrichaceae bacterium]
MSTFKCKMCGGDLEIKDNSTICECEYCGTQQTIPTIKDDVTTNLFNRANNLRMKNEFDKAQEIYEKIVSNNENESEAYWGIVLCKFGIEYVEDPATFKKIPTCHRTQLESVMTDVDYLAAIEHADVLQKSVYEAEAKAIDTLQRNILAIVHKEKPFDVFICYKETDENGKRTQDSVIANDIYHQLTQEGFKAFYAAITLEDKLGQEYEPYIFAALNSAKVMLVIGTKPEYFNAVWVKNEWSRYLKIMKNDRSKLLIPCYKDMDAYDLPEEFSHLQAQDMNKIGFINDVIRGLRKVIKGDKTEKVVKGSINESHKTNVDSLLKRANMFVEDGDFFEADEYCEKVLDIDPENVEAYRIKLMAEMEVISEEELIYCDNFVNSYNYNKLIKYANNDLKAKINSYLNENIYLKAKSILENDKTVDKLLEAEKMFTSLRDYHDSISKAKECDNMVCKLKEEKIKLEEERTREYNEQKKHEFLIFNLPVILYLIIAIIIFIYCKSIAPGLDFHFGAGFFGKLGTCLKPIAISAVIAGLLSGMEFGYHDGFEEWRTAVCFIIHFLLMVVSYIFLCNFSIVLIVISSLLGLILSSLIIIIPWFIGNKIGHWIFDLKWN